MKRRSTYETLIKERTSRNNILKNGNCKEIRGTEIASEKMKKKSQKEKEDRN